MKNTIKRASLAGFTLIELLVVVLIIGILAAIAVPQYFKIVEKGKAAEATTLIAGLVGAQETYLAQNGSYFTGTVVNTTFSVGVPISTKYFGGSIIVNTGTGSPSWSVALQRNATPGYYNQYTVTYDRGIGTPLNCTGGNNCNELLP